MNADTSEGPLEDERSKVQAWLVSSLGVSRETLAGLDRLATLVIDESGRQNLVSAATVPILWTRHVLDSAQVNLHAAGDIWLDIGTGAGFPGLVNALIARRRHILVEPRRARAEFLRRVAAELSLPVDVVASPIERVTGIVPDVITARAVASLTEVLAAAEHLAGADTVWCLHKGRLAAEEVAAAQSAFHGAFTAIPSLAAPDSFLVRAIGVKPRR